MDYSHLDRLEGFKNLYVALAGQETGLYDAKDRWESVSEDLDEKYFWTALEDLYQNNVIEVEGFDIYCEDRLELSDISIDETLDFENTSLPREWSIDKEGVSVFTDHFERHDSPASDSYQLGDPVSSLEVNRRVEKGDKNIGYLLENDNKEDEAALKLEVEFTVPEFSPEIDSLFIRYADNYVGKIERQEVRTLMSRASQSQKSTVG